MLSCKADHKFLPAKNDSQKVNDIVGKSIK